MIYILLIWIDAILFYLFSWEINKNNIYEFFKTPLSYFSYPIRLKELINRYTFIAFALPIFIYSFYLQFFCLGNFLFYSVIFSSIFILIVYTVKKFNPHLIIKIMIYLSFLLFGIFIASPANLLILKTKHNYSLLIFIFFTFGILLASILKYKFDSQFFKVKSYLRKFLRKDIFKDNPSIVLSKNHLNH
jgi:hypothetical protein